MKIKTLILSLTLAASLASCALPTPTPTPRVIQTSTRMPTLEASAPKTSNSRFVKTLEYYYLGRINKDEVGINIVLDTQTCNKYLYATSTTEQYAKLDLTKFSLTPLLDVDGKPEKDPTCADRK